MKNILNIAIDLEMQIADNLQTNKNKYSEVHKYWASLLLSQEKLIDLLNQARIQPVSFPEYPDTDADAIVPESELWQTYCAAVAEYDAAQLVALLSVRDLYGDMQEFYTQSAANVAHPLSKIFLQSLSEVKKLQQLKLSMLSATYQNKLWERLGYAPFNKN